MISSPSVRTAQVLTFAAAGLTVLLALAPQTGHDQLWLLLAASRLGPHLNPYGPTVLESNPPLALWLSAAVLSLARLLHLPVTVTFKLAVSLLSVLSAGISSRLLPPLTRTRSWFLAAAWILLTFAIPARDFGQRDHLLILLALPYLLAAASYRTARPIPIRYRFLITVAAALGIALKPHQALIPITIEFLVWLWPWVPHPLLSLRKGEAPVAEPTTAFARHPDMASKRPRLLEPIIFLTTAALYYAAIRLLAPTYLTEILPLLRDTYWAFGNRTFPQLLLDSPQLHLLAALALALALVRPRQTTPAQVVLLTAALAATAAFYLQATGWYYQQLPAITLFALALALTPLPLPAPAWLPRATAALAALTLALTWHFSDFQPQSTPDPTFYLGTHSVATLTTTVDDTVPPAFTHNLLLAQRYPHLWLLPAILRNQSGPPPTHPIPPARVAELALYQHRIMVEDLTRWRPGLILVARCQDPQVHCQVLEDRHDDLLAWFQQDPAFAALFTHYRFDRSSGPYDAYRLSARP